MHRKQRFLTGYAREIFSKWTAFAQSAPLEIKQEHRRNYKSLRGFTLIELMLVVIIISVLVAMVAPRLVGRSQQARLAAAKTQIESHFAVALGLYELDNGAFPTTEQGLSALKNKPTSSPTPSNWKGPYINKIPKDPWGNPYVYACPGVHNTQDYDLSCYGPDGIESTDDITNWEEEE